MTDEKATGLHRPYTQGTFQSRLDEFKELIKELTLQDVEATPEERRQMITENLRFDQFCESIRALFGGDIRNHDLKAIYRKISTNPDAHVDWSELFGYFQSGEEEQEITVGEEVNVFTVTARRRVGDAAGDKKRRDIVVRIKYIPALDSYLTASQKGSVSLWTTKFRLSSCTDLNESAWATGCDYLPGLRRVIACTERSINIWDSRAKGKNQQIFSIKPIEHSPQCLTWIPRSTSPHEDVVLFGDDQGYVNVLNLHMKDLTIKTTKTGEQTKSSQIIVVEPKRLTYPIRRRKLHDDWVLKVAWIPELRCFASCSPSCTTSFVLEEIDRLLDDGEVRGVGIQKGVNAFAYCARANIIATGGIDKTIRVWHPHIFSRPTGKLMGHLFTIVDISINEKDQHIISLSTARVFRIWDIHTLTSLQMMYNSELSQLMTVCTESCIKVWEAEHGKLVYQIPEPHGSGVELTAVTFDCTGYRLATGGIDGSLKIWDFGSGQEIKWKSGSSAEDQENSITGLKFCTLNNERCLIVMGWGNTLTLLQDGNDSYELTVMRDFIDLHYTPSNTSPTSPFAKTPPLPQIGAKKDSLFKKVNGHVKICQELMITLPGTIESEASQSNPESRTDRQLSRTRSMVMTESSQAVTEIKFLTHTVRKLDPAYIKKLTQHSSDEEDDDEKGSEMNMTVKRNSRLNSRVSNKTRSQQMSRTSQSRFQNIEVDQSLLDDLTIKVEGEEAVKAQKKPQESEPTRKQSPVPKTPEPDNVETNETEEEEKPSQAEGEELDDDDPDSKMIVETFAPVMVSCHQDSFIRFWTPEGELLREITAMTRRQGSPVTALCHDEDCNFIITGDIKGYLTLWDVGKFLEKPTSENKDLVKQVICWRAHLAKVVELSYIESIKAIVSGSIDGSVRIWWGNRGRFIGFFGQHRPFNFPTSEDTARTPVLPYDINEGPLAPTLSMSARQKIKAHQMKFDYPLIFDDDKWLPFKRSAYVRDKQKRKKPNLKDGLRDKKFFGSLIKPRAYRDHLESVSPTGEMHHGAVFRALPVYRVSTPTKPKTPEFSSYSSEPPPFMIQRKKTAKVNCTQTKKNKKSVQMKPSLQQVASALTGVTVTSPTASVVNPFAKKSQKA
ncbi:hypothetical protein CAPTEDRAFT_219855 [Capitella teleta]|uniref:WD repeat-containing protein 64 n=1 Tax=Capitella teleta TaxID=283909 RepID=R7U043_CAPTE|nr:hypothetical protein CAPTEDRAFT_219855 [Capitella teleta]|eukprot:ELT96575.1 hypothetical protein CAPTEDRAFT_219855 [Capitella teleta]